MNSRYLRSFTQQASRLAADRSGSVALMFGLFGTVLLSLTAGGIEMHRRNAAIQELQNAADAAALAGKLEQANKQATLPAPAAKAMGVLAAKRMFERTLENSKLLSNSTHADYDWATDGALTVSTTPSYNSAFGNILPTSFTRLNVRATANSATPTPTEFALVLDTTMSMFAKDGRPQTRFTLMRDAAKRFTHDVFNAAQQAGQPNLIRISVVPWATSVNVLGGAPAAPSFAGNASVNSIPDWGSRVPVTSPLPRAMVNNTGSSIFAPVQWRGCISGDLENPTNYSDAGQGNWNALVIRPVPTQTYTYLEGPVVGTPVQSCTCTSSTSVPCNGGGTQGFNQLIERAIPQIRDARFLLDKGVGAGGSPEVDSAQCTSCTAYSCTTITQNLPNCSSPTASYTRRLCALWNYNGRWNTFIPSTFSCTTYGGGCYPSGTNIQETSTATACVADPNEPASYNGTVPWCSHYGGSTAQVWDSPKPVGGPNLNCPSPMLGLSGNRQQVIEYLDRLTPVPGGTHADVGLRWGLRTLAATNGWPSFFGMTTPPAAWNAGAQKVMVMLTDGENEQAGDFAGYWGCNVNDVYHHCTTSPNAAELNTRMLGWCNAIRTTYNITLYVVAVNFSNAAAVAQLQACAGNPANVFNVDANQINTVLAGIASRLVAMRLVN